ncbi:unnamed protein product [Peniophora sp. CBMAI 1063]|nr:unnamed protein product [Peniophora sp. CBMAI 1063]
MADDAGAAMQGLDFGNGGGGNPGNAESATGNNGAGAGDGGPGLGNNSTGGTGDGQPGGNAAGTGTGNGGDSNGGGDGGGNGPAPDPESEDARIVRLTHELEEAFAARANKAGAPSELGPMFMSKEGATNARAAIAKPTAPPPCPIQPGFQADPQATGENCSSSLPLWSLRSTLLLEYTSATAQHIPTAASENYGGIIFSANCFRFWSDLVCGHRRRQVSGERPYSSTNTSFTRLESVQRTRR